MIKLDPTLYKITRKEVLMGRDTEYPLTPELESNLDNLLARLNIIRMAYNKPLKVSSGYRPGKYNTAAGGANNSAHMTCEACDLVDTDGALDTWCMANLELLKLLGLRLESPDRTKGWCHLDTRYKAGTNPVFVP